MTGKKSFPLAVALALLAAGPAFAAKKKPSLQPYAGSYTGTAASTTSLGTLGGPATLTFTGRPNSLSGTFLYTGILNRAGLPAPVVQTAKISGKGRCGGRVTLDGIDGTVTGTAKMRGRNLHVTMTYLTSNPAPGQITLTGKVAFKGRKAVWTAAVSGTNPVSNGSLLVKGRR